MYISKVEISKYKGFNEATIELVDGLNVILGHNNGGKSTLLDAIALVIDTERKKEIVGMGFLSRHFIGRIERKCSINKNQFVFFHVK